MTWREYGAAVSDVVSDAEGIDPPAALRGYHSATEQAVQTPADRHRGSAAGRPG